MFRDCEATGPAGALFHAMCAHLVLQAWTQHLGADNVEATSHLHPAVERTVRLLRADSSEGIDDLAKRSGLSAPQLSRLFKEQVGIPITHFRQRQRLERFVDIYGTGQRINLMDAALEAGFGSYPQFHRVFKEAYGYSPAEHRRRMKLDQE